MSAHEGRVYYLDALRGICALGVMIYHFTNWGRMVSDPLLLSALQKCGIYCVEIFFMISGFSMMLAYAGKITASGRGLGSFAIRRFFRIVPLLYFVFIATIIVHAIKVQFGYSTEGSLPTDDIIKSFTLLPIMVWPSTAMAVGSWSLGVELALYCLFPLMLMLTAAPRFELWGPLVVLGLMAASAFLIVPATTFEDAWGMYSTVINHAHFFLAGMLCGHLHLTGRFPSRVVLVAVLAASVLVMFGTYAVLPDRLALITGWSRLIFSAAAMGILVGFAAMPITGAGKSRPLVWLGDVSYSLYLVHPLVFTLAPGSILGPLKMPLAMLASLIAAHIIYKALEMPLHGFGRTVSQRFGGSAPARSPIR